MGCWQLTAARTEEEDKFSGLQCKPPFPYKIVDATILFIKTEAQCLRIGEDEDILFVTLFSIEKCSVRLG